MHFTVLYFACELRYLWIVTSQVLVRRAPDQQKVACMAVWNDSWHLVFIGVITLPTVVPFINMD